jgi:long-chain-fatty-acid--[acyl-carrier-protein] ligase
MQTFLEFLLVISLRIMFWFRYRVTVKGLDKLTPEALSKSGGILFLPNHPAALVDPALVVISVWPKFRLRPMIIEYMYFLPLVHGVMKFIRALPVPDFESSNNSIKRKRGERVIKDMIKGIEQKDNFLIYPAGRLKHTGIEDLGGASAVHQIIQEAPNVNIVLVRTKGLWGSSFSRALTGKSPPLFPTMWDGFKIALKNLFFFTPRRHVTLEFEAAPADFPYRASRIELNRWLEKWYNKPDGLTQQSGESPGDSLMLVSYKFWKKEIPEVYKKPEVEEVEIKLNDVGDEVQQKIYAKLSELTEIPVTKIHPELNLAFDLGLDSLDTADLASFLSDQFDVGIIPVTELTTVGRVLGIASKQIIIEGKEEEEASDVSKWKFTGKREHARIAEGDTIPEVFLNNAKKMGNAPCCADLRSGVLSYSSFKLGVILLADYIQKQPGKYVGILLPASVGAMMCVIATLLARKVPCMINWTQGKRHLESVIEVSKIEVVLTSWAFLEKLENVDLDGVDDKLIMLETARREFGIFAKLKALYRSKLSTKSILKKFGADQLKPDDEGVLLFTSGTESMPKGVPLSHKNILSNQRATFETIDLYNDDVLLCILPPFHSFGFTTTGLITLLSGIRAAFSPSPIDGKAMAQAFERWEATIACGAPSFIKALLTTATPEQLKTMRVCVTGAEKAPPELFQMMARMGKERCVVEGYGITECSPVIAANKYGQPRKGVGEPLHNVELLIVNLETMEPVPSDVQGLILVRGPSVFAGYLNPGIASPFVTVIGKEWYNTGDLGFLDASNRLTISGRKKRFIKIGGEMVSLPAVEESLLHAASLRGWAKGQEGQPLAVLGKEDEGTKSKLTLITTFKVGVDDINQTLRDSGFSNLVRISEVIQVPEIPLMGTGKINYRILEQEHLVEAK